MSIQASTPSSRGRSLGLLLVVTAGLLGIVGSGGGVEGGNCGILLSTTCTIDVSSLPPIAIAFVSPPKRTVAAGDTVTFTAESVGIVGPAYQWQISSDGGHSFVDLPGATTSSYTRTQVALADDGAVFRVIVSAGALQAEARGALAVSSAPAVVFSDGDFAAANWTVDVFAAPAQGGPTQSSEPVSSAGNPDAWRRMTHEMTPGPSSLHVLHSALGANYAPGVQGAITALDYSEDCMRAATDVTLRVFQSVLLLDQAGRRYLGPVGSLCNSPGWTRLPTQYSLSASDFMLLDGPACAVGQACPDFSVAGAALRFGFARITQTASAKPALTVTHGIDNWRVAVWRR